MEKLVNPRRMLIICLSGMGNFLLFTPALKHYRECYPNARIDLCVRWQFLADLLKENKLYNNCYIFDEKKYDCPGKKLRFMWFLRKNRYDTTICVFPTNRWQYNVLAYATGARQRCSFSYPRSKGCTLSFLQNNLLEADESLHDVEQNVRLAEELTGKEVQKPYRITTPIPKKDLLWGEKFVSGLKRPLFVIHPSFDQAQSYKGGSAQRISFFLELMKRLREKYHASIILIGGKKEGDQIREILDASHGKEHTKLAVGQSIGESAGIIKQANLLINIDSGLGHIASVTNTPTITIYGPAIPGRTRRYNANQRFIQHRPQNAKDYPYPFKSSKQEQPCDAEAWFAAVSVNDVIKEIDDMKRKGDVVI